MALESTLNLFSVLTHSLAQSIELKRKQCVNVRANTSIWCAHYSSLSYLF